MQVNQDRQFFHVQLQPQAWQFAVDSKVSVLEAALAAGFALPNSCRNGTCRTCVCTLISGQIAYKIEWPGLSKEEKEEGMILTCVARALTDLVLHVPSASRKIEDN